MLPQEIIRRKRDGHTLADDEIGFLIAGLLDGRITDAQVAAFAMAVFLRGMTREETRALTRAMTRSGQILDWRGESLGGPTLDKHSTGGVGDNVSLMLAPAVAACGGFVPMISGRGLGHTGGTLDKLDSIPGYVSQPDLARFRRALREAGAAIIGQTADLAPADRKLYALRDVTGTVESIPLITASILSKKLAAGLDGLVMDVKTGGAAFMPTLDQSRALARSIAEVAEAAGLPTTSLITDMDAPLASAAGNALETLNATLFLTGAHRDTRLFDVTVALGGEMLLRGKLVADAAEGRGRIARAFDSGAAAERFARMIRALGGPADFLENPGRHLAAAPIQRTVHARSAGKVAAIDARAIGIAVVALGGGRTRPQDSIDHAVGFTALAGRGVEVGPRETPLAIVHARDDEGAARAAAALHSAYTIAPDAPPAPAPVIERISGGDTP